MLAVFRNSLNTWPVRVLFLVLVVAFIVWGVSDVFRQIAQRGNAIATVNGHPIPQAEIQNTYRQQLNRARAQMGNRGELPDEAKKAIAEQATEQVVTQAALAGMISKMGLLVPDEAIRQATFAIPAFKDASGKFDRARFEAVLSRNGMDEPHFVAFMRHTLDERQLLDAVRVSAYVPSALADNLFAYQEQKRAGEAIELPFSAASKPADPTDADLKRYWDNHPDLFSTPEYRHIKAVVLTPETVARTIQVSDKDLQAAYDQNKSQYVTPEKRSVQVVLATDQPKAEAIAKAWRGGADWAAIQALAQKDGGTAIELDDSTRKELPVAKIADVAFSTAENAVSDPMHDELGWHVVKVTKVTAGKERSFDSVKEELRKQIVAQKAADQIYDRANQLDDALSGGATLDDKLPGAADYAAISGTLDENGDTEDGKPAPIPGSPALRSALIAAAFHMKKGDPPQLTPVTPPAKEGAPPQPTIYFAVQVDSITPPSRKPLEAVKDQVRDDWIAQAQRREQNEAATKAMLAVQKGQSMEDAATIAGSKVTKIQPVGRNENSAGVNPKVRQALFALKNGDATMVETADGFTVVKLESITAPDAQSDATGYNRTREALARSIGDDEETLFIAAARERAHPHVNQQMVDQIAQ